MLMTLGPVFCLLKNSKRGILLGCVLLLVLLGAPSVKAQLRSGFSNSYELFIKELGDQMSASKRDDYKKLMADFTRSWNGEYIDAQRDIIIRTANEMKRKRLPMYPYFGNYLELLQKLKAIDVSSRRFYEWHTIYGNVLTLNQRSIDQFVRSSTDFFAENAIYLSNAIEWEYYAPDYKFEFENNQVFVRIDRLDLSCVYFNDSIVIRQTSGLWYPVDQLFEGNGGRVDWQRAGFPKDSIYAELATYRINLKQFQFEVDSAVLYNKGLVKPVLGRLQDKCTANLSNDNLNYPRFTSYEEEVELDNILKNVSVRGKYALHGNRYLAVGTRKQPAEVFIFKNDTTTVRALSTQFAIRKKEIYSASAEVTVLLNKDSIYHPGISMRFTPAERKLLLFLEPGSINKIPFSNSYHQLDTYCEALSWKIDDPYIEFKMQTGLSEAIAVFTSKDYFDNREYLAAQGYATYNPLVRLFQYGRQVSENYFPADGFAAFMKLPLNSVRQLLIDLANQGFIYYDRELEEITLLTKLYRYNFASAGRIDYDIIKFVSRTNQQSNAVLNTSTRELMVNGVNVVILSDTHTVFFVPEDRKVIVTRNRGMEFSGHVHSGTLDFYGDGFSFNYDSFAVDMKNVDSMRFQVLTGQVDSRGQAILARIDNALEHITGTLYVDHPTNKSSRKPIWKYPYFVSKQESYVYYDKKEIQDGSYSRETFFFRVDPFIIDSLDFAGSANKLSLEGTMVSGGIFPEFRERLRFQDDLSLGFQTFTPPQGYEVYGGKGRYSNNITLDRQGLHGYGDLEYLTSLSKSNNYTFRLESASAQLEKFDIRKGSYRSTTYPTVKGSDNGMLWKPYADSMMVYRAALPLEVYENVALFEGDLIYTPVELTGDGTFLYGRDKAYSHSFRMEIHKAISEALRIEIASNTPDVLAVKTEDLSGEIDFNKRFGTFYSQIGETRVLLPYNEYSVRLTRMEWDMRDNKIILGSVGDQNNPRTTFRSELPAHDGFNFYAAYGAMDLSIFDLDLRGIPEMRSADAILFPDSGKALVGKDAKMFPLKNAKMLFDSLKKEHFVYQATIDVLGRRRFEAEGRYDYVTINQIKQSIYLNIIRPNMRGITTGSGTILPDSGFLLNPGFTFYGSVSVSSEKKAVNFNGSIRLSDLDDTIRHLPFRYNNEFDPALTYIRVADFKDDQNRRTFTGLYLNLSSSRIYAMIGGPKIATGDSVLLDAAGIIKYDEQLRNYTIGPELLVLNDQGKGNVLVFDSKKSMVSGTGKIRLGFDKDPIRLMSGGEIIHKYRDGTTDMMLVVMADMLLPDEALKIFSNQLVDYSFGAQEVNNEQDYVRIAFSNMLEGRDGDRVLTSIDNFGTIPINNATDYLFVITNVDLSWDGDTKSFRSKGTIGLGNMNGESINKKLNGILEIQILPTGRTLNLLIEPGPDVYFFFNYRTGRVYPVATMKEFNEAIKKGLGKKKKKGVENKVSMGITQNRDRLVSRHANWLRE
jgi:hypothetical protein